MKHPLLLLPLTLVTLVSCQTADMIPPRQRAYVPRVQMPDPSRMNADEQRYLPEFEDALTQAGYRPVQGTAEYQADLIIESGPINVDTTMRFAKEDHVLAESRGRHGGPGKLFNSQQYVQQSFLKCLGDFESRLPRASTTGGWDQQPRRSGDPQWDRNEGAAYPETPAPDWQTGRF